MKIYINGLEDIRFQRPLELLAQLFFEDCDVSFEKIDADIEVSFELDEINRHVAGKLGSQFQANTSYVIGKDERE